MKSHKSRLLSALLVCISCVTLLHAAGNPVSIGKLKVEYAETPLGIEVEKPRFSWQMGVADHERGYFQTNYQVLVATEKGQLVWDSGKIKSDLSLNIEYAGEPLQPATRYAWRVNVWNQRGEQSSASSWFETGLMSNDSAYQGWSGAKWIGGGDEDMVLYSHYLPVFKLNFSLQLDEASATTRTAFIYGANDERLMDKNKNLYHLENRPNESYIKIELDIAPLTEGKEALLNVYRVGYHPDDKRDTPFKSFPVPQHLINKDNQYARHTISLTSDLGFTRFYINSAKGEINHAQAGSNQAKAGADNAKSEIGSVNLNPLGQGGDFIAFPVVGDLGFAVPAGQAASFSKVEIANLRSPAHVIATVKDKDYRVVGDASAAFETFTPKGNSAPMLRTVFTSSGAAVAKARLYVTARGIYEIYLNGKRVGDDYFNPGITQYNKTHLYQTFDVTDYLHSGTNALGALLAEGWSTAAYNASGWKPAKEVALESNICREGSPGVNDYFGFTLLGQFGQTVKEIDELTAVSVEEVRPGVFVYDMGQNMVGVPKITLSGMKPGTKINLRFAEVKYPALPEYAGNTGMIMLENIRAAMAQDIYIARGGRETIHPRFTYHGYRLLEITGIDRPLPLESVKGVVLSSIHQLASHYETSNAKVNKLWKNITWSSYGNFVSIPTDCPQRNERLGWMGDISVFSRTATYLADVPQFLRRYLRSARDSQHADGRFPDIAPLGIGFGGLLWGSAGITVPWECYQQYGDKALLAEHYDAMKRYISYIIENTIETKTNLIVQNRAWGDLCDWLGLEDEKNDKSLVWEAYFIYDLELMSKMAAALGKTVEAEWYKELHAARKDFFNKTYIQPGTGKTIFSAFIPEKKGTFVDVQTSYVLPLAFDIIDKENKSKVVTNLAKTVVRENITDSGKQCPAYSLMTGFIGTAWIGKALSDNGYTDLAYKLLQQTSYPSWLYSVDQGATTIWERLNSYTHTDGFGGNNRMNSFNHYSFGAVGAWMCGHSLGIQRDENNPAFKHFLLKPEIDPTGQMRFAKGHYDSMYGRIESSWKVEHGAVHYEFTVPGNTTALLYLPASSARYVRENGRIITKKCKGVEYAGEENGKLLLKLQSGKYSFEVREKRVAKK